VLDTLRGTRKQSENLTLPTNGGKKVKYNLANKDEKKEAMSYFMTLVNKKALAEVKKLHRNRSLNQNAYLHLIIGYFGVQN
jgi:hypothetical protein